MLKLTKEELLAANPCDPEDTEAMFEDSERAVFNPKTRERELVYPDGWTHEDSLRLGAKSMRSLQWLMRTNLVPGLDYAEVRRTRDELGHRSDQIHRQAQRKSG